MTRHAIPLLFALFSGSLPADVGPLENVTSSWLGNSFAGTGVDKWVQQDIEDLFVTSDGTVYAIVYWDEAGGEVTAYRDGDVVTAARHTHGWGYHGGSAIAANEKYLYFGQFVENEGGHLVDPATWPPKGKEWYGIARRFRSDITRAAPFPHGKGGKGATLKGGFLVIHELPTEASDAHVAGLWATEAEVFAACPYDDTIRVFDTESMEPLRQWPLKRPGPMSMDGQGTLWILHRRGKEGPSRILRFDTDGTQLPQEIALPSKVIPTDICIDKDDRLLVSDRGPSQRVLIYDDIDTSPRLTDTFGVERGIFSEPAGRFGPLRFNDPAGVGTDAEGNIYVASSGSSARDAGGGGGSTILESYWPNGRLNWRLFGLEFIDCASLDPADENHAWTKEEHFTLDYSKPKGREWTYAGYTVNKWQYPDDPRTHIWSAGAWLRRIDGQPFLFVNDMTAQHLQVYRFAEPPAETAIPAGFFTKRHVEIEGWPPVQPDKGEWIWRDADADGSFEAGEFFRRDGKDAPSLQGWWVDSQGTVWQATERDGIRRFPCRGIQGGVPCWDYESMQTFPAPPQFDRIKRLRYDPATDTMLLGGTTSEHKNQHWKPMGPVICRYDNWISDRQLRWKIVAPYQQGSSGHSSCEPMTIHFAGEYLFVPYTGDSKELGFAMGHIEVFRLDTGARVGWMEPGPDVGRIGLQDIRECLSAHRRNNGEYVVFLEEDWKAKVLMFRWRPQER